MRASTCGARLLLQPGITQLRQALALLLQEHHQVRTSLPVLGQLAPPGLRRLVAHQLQHRRHLCQHPRIERIGLGQLSGRLGKVARLPGIEAHHRQARRMQRIKRRLLVAAGGFQHHQTQGMRRQPRKQPGVPDGRVAEPGTVPQAMHMNVQP